VPAATEEKLVGVTTKLMLLPSPLGSMAGLFWPALALRSALAMPVSVVSVWLSWSCQLATSEALATVSVVASTPPVVAAGLLTSTG